MAYKINKFTGGRDYYEEAAIGSAIGSGTEGSVLFVDSSGNLAQDNSNLYWDDTNDRLSVAAGTSPDGSLQVGGAINATRETNAFGTSSTYTAFVIGDLSGANANNGGLYAGGRYNKANEPFTGLCVQDDNSHKYLYFGGGGWGVPDATLINFYTEDSYSETNDAGKLRTQISASRFDINPNGDDYDFRVYGDTDNDLIRTDAGNDLVGIGADRQTETVGKLLVAGALNIEYEANPFGATTPWGALVVGAVNGATTNNGGGICMGRRNKSQEPALAMAFWDDGSYRNVFIGGGGFGLPDSTRVNIYTQPSYTETSNAGVERLSFDGAGAYFNNPGGDYDFRVRTDNDSTAFFIDGGSDQASFGCDPGSAVGKLGVKQPSATAAIPTLYLEQKDVSEELIYVRAASHASTAANTLVDASALTTPGSIAGWIQTYIRDDNTNISDGAYYIPFYSAPTA